MAGIDFYSGHYRINVLCLLLFSHERQALRDATIVILRPLVELGIGADIRVDEAFVLVLLADGFILTANLLLGSRFAVTQQEFLHVPAVVLHLGHQFDLVLSQSHGRCCPEAQ